MLIHKLIFAVAKNMHEDVKKILQRGIDPETVIDSQKQTPLHYAAAFGSIESAKILIEYGANIHALTKKGLTPLNYAKNHNNVKMEQYLNEYIQKSSQ